MKSKLCFLAVGMLCGAMIYGSSTVASAAGLTAECSTHRFFVDGEEVSMAAYVINGNNYVMLRDIGKVVGFNVFWDSTSSCVQIESGRAYTGQATEQFTPETLYTGIDASIPQAGDVVHCTDGTDYTIKDISRYDKNLFASGPSGNLPSASCDWSKMPQASMPEAEARHYSISGHEYLFVRNRHETLRMLYTLYNAIGENPETWRNGELIRLPSGNEKIKIQLTIPDDLEYQSFWPWRESELTKVFNSCPVGTFSMEAWDVYMDGVFQRTEYDIRVD